MIAAVGLIGPASLIGFSQDPPNVSCSRLIKVVQTDGSTF